MQSVKGLAGRDVKEDLVMSRIHTLTRDEIGKIPEQPGVWVLYKNGLAIVVEVEGGSLRKRLLHWIGRTDATDFSVEGLELRSHSDREDLADNLRKRFGLGKQAREPIGFSRPA